MILLKGDSLLERVEKATSIVNFILTLKTNSKTAGGRRKRTDKQFVKALNLFDPENKKQKY